MEVITIESDAFNKIIARISDIEHKVADIVSENMYPLEERWLDNQQVCELLKISKRLLQMYRDQGVIPFSQVNHKIYYKASDIQKYLVKNYKPVLGYK
jgi:hypothetical protein